MASSAVMACGWPDQALSAAGRSPAPSSPSPPVLASVVDTLVDGEGACVGYCRAVAFELLDFRQDVGQRRLHGLDRGGLEMGQVGGGGGLAHLELCGRRADAVEGRPSFARQRVLAIGLGSQRGGGLFGGSHVGAQAVERGDGGIEPAQRLGGRLFELDTARGLLRALERERVNALREFARGLFQTRDFGNQRRGALDQAGVRRLGLGDVGGQSLDAVARVAQALLGRPRTARLRQAGVIRSP